MNDPIHDKGGYVLSADLGSFAAAFCHALVGIILFHFLLFSCDEDSEHGE